MFAYSSVQAVWPMRLLSAFLLVAASVATHADQFVEVTAKRLNVRAAPSVDAPVIYQVGNGDRLVVVPATEAWARVDLGPTGVGFISRRYVKALDRSGADTPQPVGLRNTNERPSIRSDGARSDSGQPRYAIALLLLVLALALVIATAFRTAAKSRRSRDPLIPSPSRPPKADPEISPGPRNAELQRRRDISDASENKTLDIAHSDDRVHELPLVKVIHVVDGDTVIVGGGWRETRIRLDSIDCPEDGQPWGDTATAGLIKMIGGRRVRIEEHGIDHYGRRLATLYVRKGLEAEWVNVNEKMVAKGHAWVMRKYYGHLPRRRQDKLNRIEKWARVKKVGLWSTKDPIPPWRWRAIAKKGSGSLQQ